MQALCSRILAFLMIGVVLTFSTGMGLVEHTCLVSGKKSVLAKESESCCTKAKKPVSKAETSVQKNKCCKTDVTYLQVDFVSFNEKVSKFFANLSASVTQSLVYLFNTLVQRSETACSYTNSSPPDSGRTLLIKHGTLRV